MIATGKKKKFNFSVRAPHEDEIKSLTQIVDNADYQYSITGDVYWLNLHKSTQKRIIELKENILKIEERLFLKD